MAAIVCPSIQSIQKQIEDAEKHLNELKSNLQMAIAVANPVREKRTKLKWILNDETYRVAIVTKDGILEVKNVFELHALRHNPDVCTCVDCSEIHLANKSWGRPSWCSPRAPLYKTLYATEAEWRADLPQDEGGSITITPPLKRCQ